jgi:hypothetical protein
MGLRDELGEKSRFASDPTVQFLIARAAVTDS